MFALGNTPRARVISLSTSGRPRVLMGSKSDDTATADMMASLPAEDVARAQLVHNADTLKLSAETAQAAQLEDSHALSGGAHVVRFKQHVDGVEVFQGRASVVLDAHQNLVSLTSNLAPGWGSKATAAKPAQTKSAKLKVSPEAAVAQAYSTLTNTKLDAASVSSLGSTDKELRDYKVATAGSTARVITATAKQVLFPEGEALQPAYHVEVLVRGPLPDTNNQAFGYVISATDGHTFWQAPLTASDKFSYRVWALPDGNHAPTDGPQVDLTPSKSGKPEAVALTYTAPILVEVDGFNKNPDGQPDPWLETGATYTFGNNVNAYSDRDQGVTDAGVASGDGWDEGDVRADVTSPSTFDRVYDVEQKPDVTNDQIKAAVTQIFYTTNWLHDYFYDSGFNEAAGNGQLKNYGRGGTEGDPLLAEAQDSANSGASNNANMSAMSDGQSPRMQMYVWSGVANRKFATTPAVTISDVLGASDTYGPMEFDLSKESLPLTLVDDGSSDVPPDGTGTTGSLSDGCQALTGLKGQIAVIDRGQCTYLVKLQNAQAAGAAAVLILNNVAGNIAPTPAGTAAEITIPLLTLSLEDATKLKAALSAATADAPVLASTFSRGNEVQHDGTIDNTVVAHEWGHYLHHRLVLCGQSSCGGMSEGFGDFNALMLTIRDGDPTDGVAFPIAQYATAGTNPFASYYGIRRAPYSTSTAINPFTFKHVSAMSMLPTSVPLAAASADMSEVHNVGEIWAQMLFEGYVNLLNVGKAAGRPFEESKRRMADYLVAGLKATPIEPSFSEQRDAILEAAWAAAQSDAGRMDDFLALARGFAKRGLGVGATAPPVASTTLVEAVESNSLAGELSIDSISSDDSTTSCDNDGHLDSGEAGKITVRVNNTGWSTLSNTRVKVESTDAALSFDNSGVVQIPEIQPYGHTDIAVGVKIATGATSRGLLKLAINATNPDAVVANANFAPEVLFNYDDVPAAGASDDFESENNAWTLSPQKLQVWKRQGDVRDHFWHGADIATVSDERLESPEISVRSDVPFVINLTHRFSFETNPAPTGAPVGLVAYDGAVIEISEDGGASWRDISGYSTPGYTGTVFKYPDDIADKPEVPNALEGRPAFTGVSPGYPAFIKSSIDLGTKVAGENIRLRFRIGTDEGSGLSGWDIDDISFGSNSSFSSISNTPFGAIVPNAKPCGQ